MDNKKHSAFSRTVMEDGSVKTEYKNDVYDLVNIDNRSEAKTDIELKQHDTNVIIRQLFADLSYTNNKINLMMTVLEQLTYQGVVPNEILNIFENSLNTTVNRKDKQK